MKKGQDADMAVVLIQTTVNHIRKVSSDNVTLADQSAPRLPRNSWLPLMACSGPACQSGQKRL